MVTLPSVKPLEWMGDTRRTLLTFPKRVRQIVGQALYAAQLGDKHQDAKPLKGFGGASVVEIVSDHDGNTFRAVYTVKFRDVVYTLHVFQKKSKTGITTPKRDLDIVRQRLQHAEHHYRTHHERTTDE